MRQEAVARSNSYPEVGVGHVAARGQQQLH